VETASDAPIATAPSVRGDKRRGRRWLFVLTCVVLFVAAMARYWVPFDPGDNLHRDPEGRSLAFSLVEKGKFSDPFAWLETGPSAHMAPLLPAYLALLIEIFGKKAAGAYAVLLSGLLILALQLALLPLFGNVLGMGRLTGVIAAAIWIAAKIPFFFLFEAFYASLLLAIACCIYRRFLDAETPKRRLLAWFLGFLMGLLALTAETVLPIFAAWIVWEFYRRKRESSRQELLPLVLLPALIITPWTLRNALVFHRFILVRDDLGLELGVSNNECATFSMYRNIDSGCFNRFHPNHNVAEAAKVRDLGEAEYNTLRLHEALHWIRAHPSRFLSLTAWRFAAFWFPTIPQGPHYYFGQGRRIERSLVYLLTFLSIPGLIFLCRRDPKSAGVCISCLTLFPIIYYFIEFDDRYRDPILWVTFLLGAFPIALFLKRFRERHAWPSSHWCVISVASLGGGFSVARLDQKR